MSAATADLTGGSPTAAIGADVRALRKARGMTLAELALALGRSVGWVSQVERGLSAPSIADLKAIAALFGQPLGFFFKNDDGPAAERGIVVRSHARRVLGSQADGLVEELLSPDLGGSFEVFRCVFAPGAELPAATQRATEEAGYLVSGTLELSVDGQWFRLQAGDSFRLAGQPMRWRNPGDEPAVAVWVIAPPVY